MGQMVQNQANHNVIVSSSSPDGCSGSAVAVYHCRRVWSCILPTSLSAGHARA